MSFRYPAGLITAQSLVNAAYPSGVWTPAQTNVYNSQNVWQYDQYWRNTTLLLHGDGTNGAQNNTFLDSSSNNFSITRNGNTTQGAFTPYQPNGYWSNYFDGNGDYLTVANNTALDMGTGDFTLEFWLFSVDASQNTQWRRFVCTGANGSESIQVGHLGNSSGTISYTADDTAPTTITSTTVVLNKWAHIAVVRQSGTVKLYVNGVSEGTPITDSNSKSSTAFTIGRYPGLNGFTNGYISNVRLVKGTAVYTSNFTPTTTPFTAINGTSLLTCQSNRFIDNSTNAFAITRNGDTSVQAFQPFPGATTWSASVLGGSGYFDGSGDYLRTPTDSAFTFGTGDFQMECWVYPTVAPDNFDFIMNGNGGDAVFWACRGANLDFVNNNDTAGALSTSYPTLFSWTHLVVVRSGSTVSLYKNGVRQATATSSFNWSQTNFTIMSGNDGASAFTKGYIADVRILKGSTTYNPSNTTITVPTAPLTSVTGTSLLLNFTNAGIFDNAQMNNLETVGNAQVSTSVVKYGTGSIYLDGSGDWLAGPPTPQTDLGSGDFTIEAWLYRTASGAGSDSGIVSRGAPSTLNGFVFGYTSSNVLTFGFNYSGAIVTGTTAIPANTWTHVAVSRSGNTFRLFVNGVVDATATSTNSQTTNAGDIFYVGRSGYDSGRIVTGYLDDVRLTKGVARYVAPFTPPPARMPNQ